MSAECKFSVDPGFRFGCLRALEPRDAAGMLEWMRDQDVASVFQSDFSRMNEARVLGFIRSSCEPGSSLHFSVADENDVYMGTVSLKNVDAENRCAEYAISMRSSAHGTGLSMRATRDVLKYAFGELGLHRVYLCVRTDNVRARKFYRKAGFVYEGTARDTLMMNGEFVNLEWYSVLEGEFYGVGDQPSSR